MIGTEQHFRDTLGQARAVFLLESLQAGDKDGRRANSLLGFVEARTEPDVIHDQCVKHLGPFEDNFDGIRHVCPRGQHLWIIDDIYGLRRKKLKAGYKTSNHRSKQQSRIQNGEQLEGVPRLEYVTAGARYSPKTGLAIEWVIVKHVPTTKRVQLPEWVLDLEQFAAGEGEAGTPTLPLPLAPAAAAPAAMRRRLASRQSDSEVDWATGS